MAQRASSTKRGGGRRIATLPRRLVAGVLIGIGTIVGAKGDRDQHWSIPPTMVSDADQDASASGDDNDGADPDRRAGGADGGTDRLPACA